VGPTQLRALGAQLQQVSGELQAVEGRISSALGGLAWEARQKANVDGQANHARSQARALAAQAEEMARYLQRKAQAFEEADGRGVGGVGQVASAFAEWVQGAPSWWGLPSQRINAWWNLGGVLGEQSPISLLHLPAVAGIAVVGLASLTPLSQAFSRAIGDFGERIWNWLHGKGWKTNREMDRGKSETEATVGTAEQPDARPHERKRSRRLTREEIEAKIRAEHGRLPGSEQCTEWAQSRRKDFNGTALPAISMYNRENWGAYNYIDIFDAKRVDDSNARTLEPGTALVWDRGQKPGPADATYGHIAIFEGFAEDGVLISDANLGDPVRKLSWEEVKGLYMIPLDAQPVKKAR